MTRSIIRQPLHLMFALLLAAGLNVASVSDSEARKRRGAAIAAGVFAGIAAAAIISSNRRRRYYNDDYYYAAPRYCRTRRHCFYNDYGERYCHRDRICGRRVYCPY